MSLVLGSAPSAYGVDDQNRVRRAVMEADSRNLKKGQDLVLGFVKENGVLRPQRVGIYGTNAGGVVKLFWLTVELGDLKVTESP